MSKIKQCKEKILVVLIQIVSQCGLEVVTGNIRTVLNNTSKQMQSITQIVMVIIISTQLRRQSSKTWRKCS